jgi:Ca2+-binding RTX toxin-like protein
MAIILGTNDADSLTASQDGDVLIGLEGDDTLQYQYAFGPGYPDLGTIAMFGDGGNDTLTVASAAGPGPSSRVAPQSFLDGGDGNDTVSGSADADTLFGGDGNDTLNGGGFDDSVSGGAGDDGIAGGAGSDTVEGGPGNDVYVLAAVNDSTERTGFGFACPSPSCSDAEYVLVRNTGLDSVYGFDNPGAGDGDRIDLSGIDPFADQAGDQAFAFAGEWTDATDPRGVGRVWLFDADWGDVTVIQGWIGYDTEPRNTASPIGDWFQIWIFDGDARAADYAADDFIL